MTAPSSSSSGGHPTSMEQLLKDVFRLHKHTVNEFRGKQTQHQEAVAAAHRERDRCADKVQRLERELDVLRSENSHLRELGNISHSRHGEASCLSCPRLQKTISVMQDAYERSLLEKDCVIKSLEERLEVATKAISGSSRTSDSPNQSRESRAEVSDLNLSSRSHKGTSPGFKGSPDSTSVSHSKSAANQMSSLPSANQMSSLPSANQRSNSPSSKEKRPLLPSTNERRSVSPSANEKSSDSALANQERSVTLSAYHRSGTPAANQRSASPSTNLQKDTSLSAKTSQLKRRSDSPSSYKKQSEQSAADEDLPPERPRLRKAASESEKDSRLMNLRNKESIFLRQNQRECRTVDNTDDLSAAGNLSSCEPGCGDEAEMFIVESSQEENHMAVETEMQEMTGAPKISPRSGDSKLHLNRRNKRSRYVEEDKSGIDPKRQRASPQSSGLPSECKVRNAADSSTDHLSDLIPVEHTEQERPAAAFRVLVPETCDVIASLVHADERERGQLGHPVLDCVVPETIDHVNAVVIESSDDDDDDTSSYSVKKTAEEQPKSDPKGKASMLDDKDRDKDAREGRSSWKGSGGCHSRRPQLRTPVAANLPESPCKDSQDSLPSLHSQAFADMTLPPSSKKSTAAVPSDSPQTPIGDLKTNNSNNSNAISPCIFEEDPEVEAGWLNSPATADADETMLPVRDGKLLVTSPDRETARKTRAKPVLLGTSSNKNSPGTPGLASDSESPLLLQLGRRMSKDGGSDTGNTDDLRTRLCYPGEAMGEEQQEAAPRPKDSPSLSLLEGVACGSRVAGEVEELEKSRCNQQRSSSNSNHGEESSRRKPSLQSSSSAVDLTSTPSMEVDKSDDDDEIPNSAESGKSLRSWRSRSRIHPRAMSLLQDSSKSKKSKSSQLELNQSERTSNPSRKESMLRQTTLSQMFEMNSPERRRSTAPIASSSCVSLHHGSLQKNGDETTREKTAVRDKSDPSTEANISSTTSEASLHEIQNTDDLQSRSAKTTDLPSKQRENKVSEFKKPQRTLSKRSLRSGSGAGASMATESLDLRETLPAETPSLALQSLDFLTESSQSSQGRVRGRDLNGSLDPDFNLTSMCEETDPADKEMSRTSVRVQPNSPELKSCMQTVEICQDDDEGGKGVESGEDVADVTMDPRFMKAHTSAAPPMEDDSIPSSYVFPATINAGATLEPSQTGGDLASGDGMEGLVFDDDDNAVAGSKRNQEKASVMDCSFDRVPKKLTAPNYAYADVVRKQGERKKLKGASCQECEKYYRGLGVGEAEIAQRIQQCSRHRAVHLAPSTPPHYWSIGFPDTEECKNRGYIQEAKSPKPLQNRRRRQLRSLFKHNARPGNSGDKNTS